MNFTLFTQILLLLNEMNIMKSQKGSFGQDCTPSQGDYPDKCPIVGQTFERNGKIECTHNFDCCTCGEIICNNCYGFIANGDDSAFGVKDITINGHKNGAIIDCNGDLSCKETSIFGTNIANLKFSGDGSAAYSQIDVVCKNSGCFIECLGDNSCEHSVMTIENSYGISFAAVAGQYGTFNLRRNRGGSIGCTSYSTCKSAIININNIDRIICEGLDACIDATFNVLNPTNGIFVVECKNANSCKNLKLNIAITDEKITKFAGISCNGASACQNLKVTIYKKLNTKQLTIDYLNCNAAKACNNAVFKLTNAKFKSCLGTTDGLIGVPQC